MGDFITSKRMDELKMLIKSIVAVITIALLICIFIGILQSIFMVILGDPVTASASVATEAGTLSEQIKHLVKGLEYSDKVAEDFTKMAISWKDEKGKSVLVSWRKILDQAKEDSGRGRIS
jgi:predicted PurR-regulated permease PerM